MALMMRVRTTLTGFSGGPGLATHHFAVAVGDPNDAAAELATDRVGDAFIAGSGLWPTTFSAAVSGEVEVVEAESGDLVGTLPGNQQTVAGTSSAGGYYAAPTGIQVTWLTPDIVNSHRVRGRTFLVPLANALNDNNGTPGAPQLALAEAFADAMLDPGLNDCIFGVWARPYPGRTLPTPIAAREGSFHGASGSAVPDKFVVLRSRRD